MPFIPLSFVVALLLLMLFVIGVRTGEDGNSRNTPFLALILVTAFQAFLSGLRWGYGVVEIMYVAPVGAALVPPLVYCGVARLAGRSNPTKPLHLGLHAVPSVAIVLLIVTWRGAIDAALPAIFIFYAVAILHLMRSGPDALRRTPFESAAPVYRALIFASLGLFLSAALDLFVFLDFAWTKGKYTPAMVATGNLLALIVLAAAAAVAARGREPAELGTNPPHPDDRADKDILAAIETLMTNRHSYRDPDLNLDRLARKAIIPARQISAAINRKTGKNVSQYVNEFRIAEACRLLEETEKSVIEIMFEVGFQTKSNFNREFRRVTDITPVQWRQRWSTAGNFGS